MIMFIFETLHVVGLHMTFCFHGYRKKSSESDMAFHLGLIFIIRQVATNKECRIFVISLL